MKLGLEQSSPSLPIITSNCYWRKLLRTRFNVRCQNYDLPIVIGHKHAKCPKFNVHDNKKKKQKFFCQQNMIQFHRFFFLPPCLFSIQRSYGNWKHIIIFRLNEEKKKKEYLISLNIKSMYGVIVFMRNCFQCKYQGIFLILEFGLNDSLLNEMNEIITKYNDNKEKNNNEYEQRIELIFKIGDLFGRKVPYQIMRHATCDITSTLTYQLITSCRRDVCEKREYEGKLKSVHL